MHCMSSPCHHLSYIDQCQGDFGLMAVHYGWSQTAKNLTYTFLAPIVSSVSDTWGRRVLHAVGRLGPVLWFLGLPSMTLWYSAFPDSARVRRLSLLMRLLMEVVCWGTFTAVRIQARGVGNRGEP